jgi:hypothetical protein
MYLLVNDEQKTVLDNINNLHSDRKIMAIKSNNNNWIVKDDLLVDCDEEHSTWHDWKDWLLSLEPTEDIPSSKPKPQPKPRNNGE